MAGLLLLLIMTMTVVFTGCSNGANDAESGNAKSEEEKGILYPVSINGTEIRVGETTVQSLLDQGLKLTVSEMTADKKINTYEIDPETELEANSYYSGGTIDIADSVFAHISLVTNESAIRMGDAVIAYMEFSLTNAEKEDLANILFNGVPVTEISREKAGEMFPDFEGDDVMWFSPATQRDYKYFMSFSLEDHMLSSFHLEKKYDVDWNSKK